MNIPSTIIVFIGPLVLWIPLFWLLASVSGWRRLAHQYRAHGTLPPPTHRFRNGTVGYGLSYRGGLHLAVRADGLWVWPSAFFRPGHPPLYVPWGAVTRVWEAPQWGYRAMGMQLQACPDLPILLPAEAFATVQEHLPAVEPPPAFPLRQLRIVLTWLVLMLPGLGWLGLVQLILPPAW